MIGVGLESVRTKKKKTKSNGPSSSTWTTELVDKWMDEEKRNVPHTVPSPYLKGQIGVRRPNLNFKHTEEEIEDFKKCRKDICYFVETYCKTMTDDGIMNITLRPYQKRILRDFQANRLVVFVATRQIGKTTMAAWYILWYNCFHKDRNSFIVANKQDTAQEIIDKLQISYTELPFYLKPGAKVMNQGNIEFDNGSRIIAKATSATPGLGFTIHLLYLDEFAHVPANIVDPFWRSVYPTLSSSKVSQMIITSTFNGTNKFWEIYSAAEKGRNRFFPIKVDWWEVPGRDEAWRLEEIANMGSLEAFNQEYGNMPISYSKLLFPPETLKKMNDARIRFEYKELYNLDDYGLSYENLKWFNNFDVDDISPNDRFVLSVDPAEGVGKDYSVINIFRLEAMSVNEINSIQRYDNEEDFFRLAQVGVFRANDLSVEDFATMVYSLVYEVFGHEVCTVIVEVNRSEGVLIIDKLSKHEEFYSELVFHTSHTLDAKFEKPGIKLNKQNKILYCRNLKQLAADNKILLREKETVKEAEKFGIRKNGSYGAITGHDDLLITCVNATPFFTSSTYSEFISEVLDNLDLDVQSAIDGKLRDFKIDRDSNEIDYSMMRDFQ